MPMDSKALEEGRQLTPQFEKRGGLLPVVVQDADTLEILMLAYTNQAALDETCKTGLATFWSSSRNELWTKGKTSGDYLTVTEVFVDCDQDAFVYRARRQGDGVCHTKDAHGLHRPSCFYRKLDLADGTLDKLDTESPEQ